MKKIVFYALAAVISISTVFGFGGCQFDAKESVNDSDATITTPETPENPPVVDQTPDDEDKEEPSDPDNEQPENPPVADPTEPDESEKEDSENPEKPIDPETPVDPIDPVEPEKPDIDYDKLTAADLTAEQRATIINNVTTALEKNIQRNIGNSGVVNKTIAIDFEDNFATLLLDYTNNSLGNMYGLFKYEMSTEMNYKNLLTTEIAPKTSNGRGEALIQISATSDDERVEEGLNKLFPSINTQNLDFKSIINTTGPTLPIGGTNTITIYTINKQEITKTSTYARSDGNISDVIEQSILHGEEGKTYTTPEIEIYKFSNSSLYNFNGLEKEIY